MPLIGTISGSNGTVKTAVTGTLVIANTTAANFPQIASSVTLYVSGTKTASGADNPSIIFAGDSFVSGALGTDSYIQMKPVGSLQIPTNTTASYIYTSGSTNDLYFTQYEPGTGYTNTTRLRWLESMMVSGLLSGGVLSTTNGTTTFSITAGTGLIINYNASTTADPYPTINFVQWSAQSGISLTYAATAQITYIAIDSTGAIVQRNSPFTDGEFNSYIVIGRVLHQSGGVTNGTVTSPTTSYASEQASTSFMRVIGPLKISGHSLSVNATATNPPTNTQYLGLTKTGGDSFVEGRNYISNPSDPWYIRSTTDGDITTSKIFREYVNGSGAPVILNNGGSGYTAIDPTQYNNAGTLTAANSAKFTIQRVYWFPNAVNQAFYVYYGNKEYQSLNDAEAGILSEVFTEGSNTIASAILVGYVLVKGNTTNLNTTSDARIIQAGIFRGGALGGGGGVSATSPGGSDTQVQFNDGGTVFGGDSGLTFNKTTDTLSIAGGLNVTGSLNVSGSLTFSFSNTGSLGAGAYSNFAFGNQSFVGVDTRVNDYTGTLPLINSSVIGRTYMVKDIGGNCGVNNFVIEPSSPNKIDGATQLKIQAASGSIVLTAGYDPVSTAYNWYIVSVS